MFQSLPLLIDQKDRENREKYAKSLSKMERRQKIMEEGGVVEQTFPEEENWGQDIWHGIKGAFHGGNKSVLMKEILEESGLYTQWYRHGFESFTPEQKEVLKYTYNRRLEREKQRSPESRALRENVSKIGGEIVDSYVTGATHFLDDKTYGFGTPLARLVAMGMLGNFHPSFKKMHQGISGSHEAMGEGELSRVLKAGLNGYQLGTDIQKMSRIVKKPEFYKNRHIKNYLRDKILGTVWQEEEMPERALNTYYYYTPDGAIFPRFSSAEAVPVEPTHVESSPENSIDYSFGDEKEGEEAILPFTINVPKRKKPVVFGMEKKGEEILPSFMLNTPQRGEPLAFGVENEDEEVLPSFMMNTSQRRPPMAQWYR